MAWQYLDYPGLSNTYAYKKQRTNRAVIVETTDNKYDWGQLMNEFDIVKY